MQESQEQKMQSIKIEQLYELIHSYRQIDFNMVREEILHYLRVFTPMTKGIDYLLKISQKTIICKESNRLIASHQRTANYWMSNLQLKMLKDQKMISNPFKLLKTGDKFNKFAETFGFFMMKD